MKNIFKLMGIAVLACSMMMVSCGKDPAEPTDSTPDTPVTPTAGVTVTWDGTELSLGYKDAYQSTGELHDNLWWFEAAKAMNNDEPTFPWIFVPFWNEESNGFLPAFCYYLNDHPLTSYKGIECEVYDDHAITITYSDESTREAGDYQFIEGMSYTGANPTVNFDATNLTLTTHFAITMYNYEAATQGQAVTKVLDLNFVNFKFEATK